MIVGRASLASFAIALATVLALASPAVAAAPPAGTDPPGFYRMRLGAFEITALFDGTLDMPAEKVLTHTTRAEVWQALAAWVPANCEPLR